MHALVPAFILDNYASGQVHGSFAAAGMFVDISGFSAMTEALMDHGQEGAEALAEIMRRVFSPMLNCIYARGGFVARSAGDSLTVLFPAGDGEQAAASSALGAAWEIQDEMGRRTGVDTPFGSFQVSAKVGLAGGQVHWGILSSADGRRAVYYFAGSAIDACAAAQQHAAAGEIVMDAAFYGLVGALAEAEGRPPHFRLRALRQALPQPPEEAAPVRPHGVDLQSRFYPPEILALEHSGEFRQVVNLFINLPSVTTEAQLAIFIESLFALQEKYQGFLNSLDFGDKGTNLLLFWGAPAAYENDIQRALNFILDLQTATSIPIRAALTYRIAHAGFIGGQQQEEYTCFGRGVNLAARFVTAAPRGAIWVDEFIAARAAQRFEIEPAGELRFKGFGQPQKIFVLHDRKEEEAPFFSGALAGRQSDLQDLRRFIQPIFSGGCAGFMLVSGEPGIGKSRLVYDFLSALQAPGAPGVQIFTGQTNEIVRGSLNPFKYWLHRYFGVAAAQGEARSKRSFNRVLGELIAAASGADPTQTPDAALAFELDRTRSFLGALVGLHWPDSLYEELDAAGRYENTFQALAALLQAESLRAPVILLLEDIHWIDNDSLAFLTRLGRILSAPGERAYPLAILATSRAHLPDLGWEELEARELSLEGLPLEHLSLLAGDLLGAPPAPGLLHLLEERSEGNPFYAGQVLRYLQEQGVLALKDGAWQVQPGRIHALPVDVNALLVARLDHLPARVRETVQTASVLGREFDVPLLCHMLGRPPGVIPPEVSAAEQEAIWKPWGELHYIFTHTLLRDAAYQMQLQSRRRALHALALEAYETHSGDGLAEHYGALAYHAGQAGLKAKVRHYNELQGRAALEAYQNNLAIDCFTRALALTPTQEAAHRAELLLLREQVYQVQAHNTDRAGDLAELEALLPELDDASLAVEVRLRQARLELDMGQYPAADLCSSKAADLAEAIAELDKAAAACRYLSASALRQARLDEAAALARRSVSLAERSGNLQEQGWSLNTLGRIAAEQGNLAEAQAAFLRSLEIGRQMDDPRLMGTPLNNLGMLATHQWDYPGAQAYFRQSLDAAEQIGDRPGVAVALGNLGFIAGSLGDFSRARHITQRYLRICREVGDPYLEANALINQGAWSISQDDFAAAGESLGQALQLTRRTGSRSGEAWALTYLGHLELARGDLAAAGLAYTSALDIRAELGQPDLACEPRAGLARLAQLRGDLPEALRQVEAVLDHLQSGGSLQGADQPLRVELTCYQALQAAGDPRAAALIETAYQTLQERAAKIDDPLARQGFLTNIPYHRELLAAYFTPGA